MGKTAKENGSTKTNSKIKNTPSLIQKIPYKKWQFWATLGGICVVIATAIVVALNVKLAEKQSAQQEDIYYTVNFETNGGNPIESQRIKEGGVANCPEDPKKDGHDFVAWYGSSEQTDKFDFSTTINKDITLYAKWIESTNQSENNQNNENSQQASGSNGQNSSKSSSNTSTSRAPEPNPTPAPESEPAPTPTPTPTPTADYNLNNQQWIGFVLQSYVDRTECAQFLQGVCNKAMDGAKIIREYRYVISDVSYSAAAREAAKHTRTTSVSNPNSVELFFDRTYSDYANDPTGTYNPKYILNEYWCAQFGLSCARW